MTLKERGPSPLVATRPELELVTRTGEFKQIGRAHV